MSSACFKRDVKANGAKPNLRRFVDFVLLPDLGGRKELTTKVTKGHEGYAEATACEVAGWDLTPPNLAQRRRA